MENEGAMIRTFYWMREHVLRPFFVSISFTLGLSIGYLIFDKIHEQVTTSDVVKK